MKIRAAHVLFSLLPAALGCGGGVGTASSGTSTGGGGAASSTGATGGAGGTTTCLCASDADCAAIDSLCETSACVACECVATPLPEGTKAGGQTIGDCLTRVCDGAGAPKLVPDDADIADDANECTVDSCIAGVAQHVPLAAGAPCGAGGALHCDGFGTCVECVVGVDCASLVCAGSVCQAPTCVDGVGNGTETDLDCGGASCPPCGFGAHCLMPVDCQGGTCINGVCTHPDCSDGVMNGGESDVDCGGPCAPCAAGQTCTVNAECSSQICAAGVCATATCTDVTKNGAESDVDCGGSCPGCGLGKACAVDADCASGQCTSSKCVVGTGPSCKTLLAQSPGLPDGVYTLDPDGAGGNPPFQAYCDMTTDAGGWALMATLRTANTFTTAGVGANWAGAWSDDWFIKDHGNATDPAAVWVNQDARKFRPLITAQSVLRATTPANAVKRYHFGFTQTDWDLWGAGRVNSGVNVVGPFNLANVKVSTAAALTNPAAANSNGHWSANGTFYLGTVIGGGDADDGTASRFHVGTNQAPTFGYAGNQQIDTRWSLWVR